MPDFDSAPSCSHKARLYFARFLFYKNLRSAAGKFTDSAVCCNTYVALHIIFSISSDWYNSTICWPDVIVTSHHHNKTPSSLAFVLHIFLIIRLMLKIFIIRLGMCLKVTNNQWFQCEVIGW